MLFALIHNEFIKLFSKKKTYIVIILFIVLLGIIVAVGETSENRYLKYQDPAYRIENLKNQMRYEQEYLEQIKNDVNFPEVEKENQIANAEQYIKSLETQIETLTKQIENPTEVDWKEDVKKEIENLKETIKLAGDDDQKVYTEREIRKLETHLKYDIPLDEENLNKGFNHLYMSLTFITSSFLAFGLVLFNADNISSEYNPGTLKFLLIQPVTRIKVLLSKYIVMVISSLALIIGIQLIFTAGIGLIKGFGSLQRPMLVGVEYEYVMENGIEVLRRIGSSGYFISFGQYLIRLFLLEALFIITMTAFIYMVSTISKSSVISMTIGIGLLIGCNILFTLSSTYKKISHLIFIHFTDINSIVTGNIVGNTNSMHFTYGTVVIVSIITTAIFITISQVFFKKRDILI